MATVGDGMLRDQLVERRVRLRAAREAGAGEATLERLLEEVDAALQRVDRGSFGLCEVCEEPIETSRLTADPLTRTCLDHLTPDQQRLLEQDLDLASRIQAQLLPTRHLHLPGWEVRYHYEPAGPVSGDHCDLIPGGPDGAGFLFCVGDVSGKGVAASMLMTQLHAIIRSLLPARPPLDQLMERTNRLFCEATMAAHYATLVCGAANGSGDLEICNAGHPPPLLLQGNGVTSLEATGVPVGLFCGGEYPVRRVRLDQGESLVLYTDGLSEARDRSGNEFGISRLSRLLAEGRDLHPDELIGGVLENLAAFRSGAATTDDLTLMVVRRVDRSA